MPVRLLLLAALMAASSARATPTISWTGAAGDSLWETATNWNPARVPTTADTVTIAVQNVSVRLTAPTTIAGLQLSTYNTTLTLDADLTVTGAASLMLNTASIVGTSDLSIGGVLTWRGGTIRLGTVTAAGGVAFTGAGASAGYRKTLDGTRLVVPSGQTAQVDGWYLYGTNGAELVIEAGAILDLPTRTVNAFWIGTGSTTRPRLTLDGTLRVSADNAAGTPEDIDWDATIRGTVEVVGATAGLRFDGAVTDDGGTYDVQAGVLRFNAPTPIAFTSASSITGAAGAEVHLSGAGATVGGRLDVAGTLRIASASGLTSDVVIPASADLGQIGNALVVTSRGSLSIESTAPKSVESVTLGNLGSLSLAGPLALSGELSLQDQNAQLSTPSIVTVGGLMTWRGGRISGGGTVTTNGGLALTGAGASASYTKVLDGSRLVVPAGQTASAAGWYLYGTNAADLTVETGASMTVTEGYRVFWVANGSTAPPTLTVDGTLTFDVDGGSNPQVQWDLDAAGTVEQASGAPFGGTVDLVGAITDRGGTYRAAAGTLDLATQGGDVTFGPGSRIESAEGAAIRFGGNGTMRVEGALEADSLVVSALQSGKTTLVLPSLSGVRIGWLVQSIRGDSEVQVEDTAPLALDGLALGLRDALTLTGPLAIAGPLDLENAGAVLTLGDATTVGGPMTWKGGSVLGDGATLTASGGLALTGGAGSSSYEKALTGVRLVVPDGQTASLAGAYFRGGSGADLVISAGAEATVSEEYGVFTSLAPASAEPPRLTVDGRLVVDLAGGATRRLSLDWALGGTGVVDVVAATLVGARIRTACLSMPDGTLRATGNVVVEGCLQLAGGTFETTAVRDGDRVTTGLVAVRDSVAIDGTIRVLYAAGTTPQANDNPSLIQAGRGITALPDTLEVPAVAATELASGLVYDDFGDGSTVASLFVFDPDPPSTNLQITSRVIAPGVWRTGRKFPVNVSLRSGYPDGAVVTTQIDVYIEDEDGNRSLMDSPRPVYPNCPRSTTSATPNYDELRCRTQIYDPDLLPPPPDGEDYPPLAPRPSQPSNVLGGPTVRLQPTTASDGAGGTLPISQGHTGVPENQRSSCEAGPGSSMTSVVRLSSAASQDQQFSCALNLASLALNLVPGYDCYKAIVGAAAGAVDPNFDPYAYAVSTSIGALSCAIDIVPATKVISVVKKVNDIAGAGTGIESAYGACLGQAGSGMPVGAGVSGSASTQCFGSRDPNEKLGPGTDATALAATHWVAADSVAAPHLFTVFFENVATATAAARDIVVTDTLDTAVFDPASFAFAYAGVADQAEMLPGGFAGTDTLHAATFDLDLRPRLDLIAHVDATFDPVTGVIRWDLSTVDPATGEEPADILAGFLVPNDDSGNGEGNLGYRVRLRPGLTTGAASADAARIVFDANDPIDTNVWTVAADADAPQSAVEPFASAESDTETFEVRWSGDDAASGTAGSGVVSYDVYVSVNGDTPVLWQDATTETSAMYEGSQGSTYGFYSVARDRVGYVEAAPEVADATVAVRAGIATEGVPAVFAVGGVWPNPSAGVAAVALDLPAAAKVTVEVYDALGRRVERRTLDLGAARHRLPLTPTALAAGAYVVRITADDGRTITGGHARFTVVR